MEDEQVVKFFQDIGIDCEKDVLAIYISYKCHAKTMMNFELKEFQKGCSAVNCDDVAKWKSIIPQLR